MTVADLHPYETTVELRCRVCGKPSAADQHRTEGELFAELTDHRLRVRQLEAFLYPQPAQCVPPVESMEATRARWKRDEETA